MTAAYDQALAELRAERAQLVERVERFDQAIGVLEGLAPAPANVPVAAVAQPAIKKPATPKPGGKGSLWTCKACGAQGHTARSSTCPKKGATPAPLAIVQRDAKPTNVPKPAAATAFGRVPKGQEPKARPGGVRLTTVERIKANMPPREILKCTCGTKVVNQPAELLGHVRRSHGAGETVAQCFGERKAA